MTSHDEVVECVRGERNLESGEYKVDGRIDAGNKKKGIEVELTSNPGNMVWDMEKLSKVDKGTLYVPEEDIEKAKKYKESYGLDTKIKKIPKKCLK